MYEEKKMKPITYIRRGLLPACWTWTREDVAYQIRRWRKQEKVMKMKLTDYVIYTVSKDSTVIYVYRDILGGVD